MLGLRIITAITAFLFIAHVEGEVPSTVITSCAPIKVANSSERYYKHSVTSTSPIENGYVVSVTLQLKKVEDLIRVVILKINDQFCSAKPGSSFVNGEKKNLKCPAAINSQPNGNNIDLSLYSRRRTVDICYLSVLYLAPDLPAPVDSSTISTASTSTSVKIKWRSSFKSGSQFKDLEKHFKYQVTIRHLSVIQCATGPLHADVTKYTQELSIEVFSLRPYSKYHVIIRAKNRVGFSPTIDSPAVEFTTKEAEPDGQIQITNITVKNTSISIGWAEVPCKDTNGPIYFHAFYDKKIHIRGHRKNPYTTFTNLKPKTQYNITIRAVNYKNALLVGPSTLMSLTTSEPPPTKAEVSVVGTSHDQIVLKLAARSKITPLLKFEVVYFPAENASNQTVKLFRAGEDKLALTKNIKPSTNYLIKARAENKFGFGLFSDSIMATTKAAPSPLPMVEGATQSRAIFPAWTLIVSGVVLLVIFLFLILFMYKRKSKARSASPAGVTDASREADQASPAVMFSRRDGCESALLPPLPSVDSSANRRRRDPEAAENIYENEGE